VRAGLLGRAEATAVGICGPGMLAARKNKGRRGTHACPPWIPSAPDAPEFGSGVSLPGCDLAVDGPVLV
jgi:hypothetical protein